MQRTNYRCVESLNISVEVAKCGKYSQIYPVHSLFVCYKKWLILPEQSIHGKLSTHRMSSCCDLSSLTDILTCACVSNCNKSPLCCYMFYVSHTVYAQSCLSVLSVFVIRLICHPYACQNTIAHQSEPDSTRHHWRRESTGERWQEQSSLWRSLPSKETGQYSDRLQHYFNV